jgi:hypothetical protein
VRAVHAPVEGSPNESIASGEDKGYFYLAEAGAIPAGDNAP